MLRIVWTALGALLSAFRSRRDLLLEVLALRQQLAAFKSRGVTRRSVPASCPVLADGLRFGEGQPAN